ncbi:MAG: archaellin/type IV pilin N-terminal domain-containing protein [archaeon]
MLSKKGVSPLIATVLLVMIVVSIGAAVMVVIQGLTDEQIGNIKYQQEAIKCGTEIKTEILQVASTNRACVADTNTSFVIQLQNTGQKDISNWNLLVVGDTVELNENKGTFFAKGNVSSYKFNFTQVDNIQKIVLYPKIPGSAGDRNIPCSMPNLEWESSDIEDMDKCDSVSWDNLVPDAP